MEFLDDPADLTSEQRLAEIAAILATGYLRLRTIPSTENPDKGLDVSRTPAPPCVHGLTDGDPVEAGA